MGAPHASVNLFDFTSFLQKGRETRKSPKSIDQSPVNVAAGK
jgi:hypothetical protein